MEIEGGVVNQPAIVLKYLEREDHFVMLTGQEQKDILVWMKLNKPLLFAEVAGCSSCQIKKK